MLVVPEDASSIELIARMPTSDWRLLCGMVDAVEYALRGQSQLGPRWHVAQRLAWLLQSQPVRLRYDELTAWPVQDDPIELEAEFMNVAHGTQRVDRLRLRWTPDAKATQPLQILKAPAQARRPCCNGRSATTAPGPSGSRCRSAGRWPTTRNASGGRRCRRRISRCSSACSMRCPASRMRCATGRCHAGSIATRRAGGGLLKAARPAAPAGRRWLRGAPHASCCAEAADRRADACAAPCFPYWISMNAIAECLALLSNQPIDTVLYLGSLDRDAIDRFAALRVRRLAVACPTLRSRASCACSPARRPGSRSRTRSRPCAWAATWRRFNVRTLNSLFAPARLGEVYPRLTEIGAETVQAVDVASLAARALPREQGARHLLVIDMPGAEDELLAETAAETLGRFRWIALRGVDPTLYAGAAPLEAAVRRLAGEHFRPIWSSPVAESPWPVTLLEFDELSVAARRGAETEARLGAAQEATQRHQRQIDVLNAQVGERQKECEELAAARDAQARLAIERRVQLVAAQEAQAAADRRAQERGAERDAPAGASARTDAQLQQLRDQPVRVRERDEHTRGRRQGQAGRGDRAFGRAGCGARPSSGERGRRKARAAEDRARSADEKLRLAEAKARAADEQTRLANERQARIVQLEAELADLSGRQGLLQEEPVKAEAQIELIANLIWREGKP